MGKHTASQREGASQKTLLTMPIAIRYPLSTISLYPYPVNGRLDISFLRVLQFSCVVLVCSQGSGIQMMYVCPPCPFAIP